MLSMRSVGHWPMLKRMFKVQVCVLLYKEVRFHKSKVAFLPGFLSINQLGSCDLGKLLVFDVQKKLYKLPKLGGGEVIWACPKEIDFFM